MPSVSLKQVSSWNASPGWGKTPGTGPETHKAEVSCSGSFLFFFTSYRGFPQLGVGQANRREILPSWGDGEKKEKQQEGSMQCHSIP